MTSPPTGRYPSKKRHRLSGSSTNDTDNEESDNSGHKKTRSHSPGSTQMEVHFKHNTPPKNSDKSEDGDESNKTPTPINIVKNLPKAINTGEQLRAPGWLKWSKWFKDHPVEALALDPRQQRSTPKTTKNGGRGKSSKITASQAKNDQEQEGRGKPTEITTSSAKNGQQQDGKKTEK